MSVEMNTLVRDPRSVTPKIWATGHEIRCPIKLYKEWRNRRPVSACLNESPFYLTPKWGKALENSFEWYFPRPMGKNKISLMM